MLKQSNSSQSNNKKVILAISIVAGILLIDQLSKIWVKTHMYSGQEYYIFSWFRIHFIENPGMAFGMELGGNYGKLALSLFRLVAVGFIVYYLRQLIQSGTKTPIIIGISLILAGAIGNIIDSLFYGLMFSDSYYRIAEFLPQGGGYGSLLYGKVVDMLYFPLVQWTWPEWMPFIGGNYFQFFRPVFNIADASISTGVGFLLLFQRLLLPAKPKA